jgi:uncharacterized protein
MKNLFLILLKIYQIFIPKRFRHKCLFKESCSNYVFRLTKENGFSAGINALRYRIHNCNPKYFIIENKGRILLITAQYQVIEEGFISKQIIDEHCYTNNVN